MARLAELFSDISGRHSGWTLTTENDRERLTQTLRKGNASCEIKVEVHNATHLKYTVALSRDGKVNLCQRPHPGASSEELVACLNAAMNMAETMMSE